MPRSRGRAPAIVDFGYWSSCTEPSSAAPSAIDSSRSSAVLAGDGFLHRSLLAKLVKRSVVSSEPRCMYSLPSVWCGPKTEHTTLVLFSSR